MTIPRDKLFHFLGGAVIYGLAAFFLADALAFALAWLTAGLKEQLLDLPHPESHTFDGWDAYWTVAGAVGLALFRWGLPRFFDLMI